MSICKKPNQIWKSEWNPIKFENLNETLSYLKIWMKHYHIWIFKCNTIKFKKNEWNDTILEYLNGTKSFSINLSKHYNIWVFERHTIKFQKLNETL